MEKQLLKVLFSMNSHQVANPEMSLEDARSYVFFYRESGKIQVYVGLYFGDTDRRLLYTHSSNPFPEAELADIEGDARGFAEDLGAMLDELDFTRMTADEKKRWITQQEIFSVRKKEPESDPHAAPQTSGPSVAEPASAPIAPAQSASVAPAPPVQMPAPVETPAALPAQAPPMQPVLPVQMPTAPVEQPAPVMTPVPAPQTTPLQQAVPAQPYVPAVPQQSPAAASAPQARVKQVPKPQRKTTSPVPETPLNPSVPDIEQQGLQRVDDVLEEAVKAGVVKAPKAQLKKDIRSSTGMVSRDKEALARLLASF